MVKQKEEMKNQKPRYNQLMKNRSKKIWTGKNGNEKEEEGLKIHRKEEIKEKRKQNKYPGRLKGRREETNKGREKQEK